MTQELFERWPAGRPETVGLEITPTEWNEVGEVWRAICALPGGQGWVCRTDRVLEWPGGDPIGSIVSAELVGDDGTTLHVRHTGGIWRGWAYREVAKGELLRFRSSLVGTVPGSDRRLEYAVYWRLEPAEDDVRIYRPFAARFTGWEER